MSRLAYLLHVVVKGHAHKIALVAFLFSGSVDSAIASYPPILKNVPIYNRSVQVEKSTTGPYGIEVVFGKT